MSEFSLISGEVLQAARGMSPALLGTFVAGGLALWLWGWRGHRLWISCGAGLAAAGLAWQWSGTLTTTPPAVSAVVVGLAVAYIAVELVRLAVFLLGCLVAFVATQHLIPQWYDVWLLYPLGGLLAVALFRYGWMIVSSIVGTLVAAHAVLLLLQPLLTLDVCQWSQQHALILTVGLGLWIVLGVVVQVWLDYWHRRASEAEPEQPHHVPVLLPVQQVREPLWKRLWGKRSTTLPA